MNQQIIINGRYKKEELKSHLDKMKVKKVLLVHGKSFQRLSWNDFFENMSVEVVHFTEFSVNPQYEDAVKGRSVFLENGCDSIVAVGGGSAIDTAKCIKAFAGMQENTGFLKQKIYRTDIPLIAIPTTAGTGSESTRFAVIYYNGNKQSVTDDSILPDIAVLDDEVLNTLPVFQRKVTMCDALAHGIESYWSVNATKESREHAGKAISLICEDWKEYILHPLDYQQKFMAASNEAGKAINISMTTAGHAMSYKLTSLFGIPHGQAVIICLPVLWRYMLRKCNSELNSVFNEIALYMGCRTAGDAVAFLEKFLIELQLRPDILVSDAQLEMLAESVNPDRLKNNPVSFQTEALYSMYQEILRPCEK